MQNFTQFSLKIEHYCNFTFVLVIFMTISLPDLGERDLELHQPVKQG